MDKFGVEEDNDKPTKTASADLRCPVCASHLRPVDETGVLLCPKCGSKPFEKKKKDP